MSLPGGISSYKVIINKNRNGDYVYPKYRNIRRNSLICIPVETGQAILIEEFRNYSWIYTMKKNGGPYLDGTNVVLPS